MELSHCKLISSCPYYNDTDEGQVIPEHFREKYCHGIYAWCGRYLTHMAAQEMTRQMADVGHSKV